MQSMTHGEKLVHENNYISDTCQSAYQEVVKLMKNIYFA